MTMTHPIDRRRLLAMLAGSAAAAPATATMAKPKPAPLFVLDTYVAGTAYYDARAAHQVLRRDDPLILRREPANRHDDLAIEVFALSGLKLGYVPCADNAVLARLLDAGESIEAQVSRLAPGRWDDIHMRLYLLR